MRGNPLILPFITYSKTNTREVVGNTRVRPLSFWQSVRAGLMVSTDPRGGARARNN